MNKLLKNKLLQNKKIQLTLTLALTLIIGVAVWQIGWNIYTTNQLWNNYENTTYQLILIGVCSAIMATIFFSSKLIFNRTITNQTELEDITAENSFKGIENKETQNKLDLFEKRFKKPKPPSHDHQVMEKINQMVQQINGTTSIPTVIPQETAPQFWSDKKWREQTEKTEQILSTNEKENQQQNTNSIEQTTEKNNDKKNNDPLIDLGSFEICSPDTPGAIKIENLRAGISYNSVCFGKIAKDQTLYIKFKESNPNPIQENKPTQPIQIENQAPIRETPQFSRR